MILLRAAARQATNANPAVAECGNTACEKVVLNSGEVEEDGARIVGGTDYLRLTEENEGRLRPTGDRQQHTEIRVCRYQYSVFRPCAFQDD